jgi:hypothetical protein
MTERDGPRDGRFHAVLPNTDPIGWVTERRPGRRYAELIGEMIWRPMGPARSAYITVDRPRSAGGICAILCDRGRLAGLLPTARPEAASR